VQTIQAGAITDANDLKIANFVVCFRCLIQLTVVCHQRVAASGSVAPLFEPTRNERRQGCGLLYVGSFIVRAVLSAINCSS
jgi:hypothetical protein